MVCFAIHGGQLLDEVRGSMVCASDGEVGKAFFRGADSGFECREKTSTSVRRSTIVALKQWSGLPSRGSSAERKHAEKIHKMSERSTGCPRATGLPGIEPGETAAWAGAATELGDIIVLRLAYTSHAIFDCDGVLD